MMKNRRRRNLRRKTHVRGWLLLLIPFLEGWCASYAITHSWTGPIADAGQIQITACALIAIALPFIFLAILDRDDRDESNEPDMRER